METPELKKSSMANNNDALFDLIAKHFCIEDQSLERIKGEIYRETIPSIFTGLMGNDKRKYFNFPDSMKEKIDKGWQLFQKSFSLYVSEHKISYANFKSNSFQRNKQKHKLFKDVISRYSLDEDLFKKQGFVSDDRKDFIEKMLTQVSNISLPKNKDLYVVVSRDLTDWMLCSTGNSWSSCIDLRNNKTEGMFWAGVPGMFVDENRVMIYITDKSTKEYHGMVVEKAIARAFYVMNEKDKLCEVKWYPSELLSNDELKQIIPFNLGESKELERSKYSVSFIKHSNGKSCFPYQDASTMKKIGDEFFLVSGDTGVKTIDDQGKVHEEFVFSENVGLGLDEIIEAGKTLAEFYQENFIYCNHCHYSFERDDMIRKDAEYFCNECFEKMFAVCDICNASEDLDAVQTCDYDDKILCARCFHHGYFVCSGNGEVYPISQLIEIDMDNYSIDYAKDNFHKCKCGSWSKDKEEMVKTPDGYMCDLCFMASDKYDTCDECGDIKIMDDLDYGGKVVCKDCREKFASKHNYNLFEEAV